MESYIALGTFVFFMIFGLLSLRARYKSGELESEIRIRKLEEEEEKEMEEK